MIKGKTSEVDIQVFDIEKCFDALWMQECINDLFDSGFQNDKLPLLFLENQSAKIENKDIKSISQSLPIVRWFLLAILSVTTLFIREDE